MIRSSSYLCCSANVAFWHKADLARRLPVCPLFGISGHGTLRGPDYLRRYRPKADIEGTEIPRCSGLPAIERPGKACARGRVLTRLAMTSANKFRIGLDFNSRVVLERMHGAVRNPDPAAVEAAQHEAIEFFVIDTAGVREEADRDLFSELETSDAVGAAVHAGSIPRQRDVCGEFVDLGPQG